MSDLQKSSSIPPDLWLHIGRGQAFGSVANGCHAAQARCLKELHDSGQYRKVCSTWEEFCTRYAGISDRQADRLIAQLEEFGETYFRLAEIMKISPQAYRQLAQAGVIKDDTIDINGELVPITPENAARIKATVVSLRRDLDFARRRDVRPVFPNIDYLAHQFELYLEALKDILEHRSSEQQHSQLEDLIHHSIAKLEQLRDKAETRR